MALVEGVCTHTGVSGDACLTASDGVRGVAVCAVLDEACIKLEVLSSCVL